MKKIGAAVFLLLLTSLAQAQQRYELTVKDAV